MVMAGELYISGFQAQDTNVRAIAKVKKAAAPS
jgi:hypothetical protein